jgi:aerotolerance regulator-like protein
MMFGNLPLWGVGAGLASLAGVLFVLQMLRVRHRQIEVPTTMFWREAVEESRARVLRQRFRHPWAYLLFLLIACLLWLALSGLTRSANSKQDYLLILDGSVSMTHPGRAEIARDQLLADAANLPVANREVWWSGGQTLLLLAKGENALLLADRLQTLSPQKSSSSLERRLLQMANDLVPSRSLQVRIYGDVPISAAALDLLPENFEVSRATPLAPERPGNHGFIAGGIREAQSGRWDRIDLFLETVGTQKPPQLSQNGVVSEIIPVAQTTSRGTSWRYFDLPARGQKIGLQLPGTDAYPADDQFEIVLPQRRPLGVLISPNVEPLFRALVAADSALVETSAKADLVIRLTGETLGGDLPAFEITAGPTGEHAFLITDQTELDPQQLLREVHAELDLGQIDALGLAQQMQQIISVGVAFGPQRNIQVWDQLLEPNNGFTNSRSWPLFLGRALRWLAQSSSFAQVASTGSPVAHTAGVWTNADGRRAVTAGLDLLPTEAGLYMLESPDSSPAKALAVAAFEPNASIAAAATPDAEAADPVRHGGLPAWNWLVLLALALMAFEWILFQTGRIP